MFPAMVVFMMGRDMRAMDPRELLYWGTMSLAIGVGFFTAYPINWWLVSKGLKHGLMTDARVVASSSRWPASPLTTSMAATVRRPRLHQASGSRDASARRTRHGA